MGIQSDAGELLLFSYKMYLEGLRFGISDFYRESKWQDIRMKNAAQYLDDKKLVDFTFTIDGGFIFMRIYPDGIDIVENESKFEDTFGFKVKLGVFEFSWNRKKV